MTKGLIKKRRWGFTLAEVILASSLSVMVIGIILMLNQFVYTSWKTANVASNVSGQLKVCIEKMQKDMLYTDAFQIVTYPEGGTTYSAIGFPAAIPDANGFIETNNGTPPKIIWDQTIIYYVWHNAATGQDELRRMICSPRSVNMSTDDRQTQINYVVANGAPIPLNGAGYEPCIEQRTLYANDSIVLTIVPNERTFDGYTPSTDPVRSDNITFGSILLATGDHQIKFMITDKNDASSGYKMGVDSFSITPSGCAREGEETNVHALGTGTETVQDVSAYGNWSGDRHLEYAPTGAPPPPGTGYITYDFYNDEWIDTNFSMPMTATATSVEYSNRTGDGTDGREVAGAPEYIVRLAGCDDSWSALDQTGAAAEEAEPLSVTVTGGLFIRTAISSNYITVEGGAIKITLDNTSNTADLFIDRANIMARQGHDGPDGTGPIKDITFPDPAHPGASLPSVTIPAGGVVTSDWIDMDDPATGDIENFDASRDYLLTFHLANNSFPQPPPSTNPNISSWTKPDLKIHTYIIEDATRAVGDVMQDMAWSVSYPAPNAPTPQSIIYIVSSIAVSYFKQGTLTSQVYDTGMDNTTYSELRWNIAKNNYDSYATTGPGADLIIKVRCDNNKDNLLANSDWTGAFAKDTNSLIQGSDASLPAIGTGRYVQYQLEFDSKPTPGKADYIRSCVLKNLSIRWPGQNRTVDVNGYFTKKNDYGIFSVKVDDKSLLKGIEITLQVSEKSSGNNNITSALTAEVKPRNTGK